MAMDLFRALQVYVVQLGLGIVYLIIGISILKRDKKRLNQLISVFYFGIFFGFLINAIYAPLESELIVYIMHILTIYFVFIPPMLLLIFNLIILKSQKIITVGKQWQLIISYTIVLSGMLLIPDGVTINATTNWSPVWSMWFAVYTIIVPTAFVIIPTTLTAIKISKVFQDQTLKKKWRFYIAGLISNFLLFYTVAIRNVITDPTIKTAIAGLGFILMVFTAIGVYTGIGRQMRKTTN